MVAAERILPFYTRLTYTSPTHGRLNGVASRGREIYLTSPSARQTKRALEALAVGAAKAAREPKVARAPWTARTAVTEEVVMAAMVSAVVCA